MTMQEIPEGEAAEPAAKVSQPVGGDLVRRHRLSTRLWHWANALALFIMLMSGLMIFNAHPRLYWGEYGANPDAAWLEIGSMEGIAFPGWATIPSTYSLADARIWHLAFAWVLLVGVPLYLVWSLVNGHLRRDLWLTRAELKPSHIWHDIKQHARLRFPTGAAALNYNVLQKTAYLGVLLVLLPLVILTGLAMSPGFDAAVPVSSWFGGRQSRALAAFHRGGGLWRFHCRPSRHGGAGRAVQRTTFDDHRQLPLAEGARAMSILVNRRKLLGAGALGASGLVLSGCDRLNANPAFRSALQEAGIVASGHAAADRRTGSGARIFGVGHVAKLPRQRHGGPRHRLLQSPCRHQLSPTGGWKSSGWSNSRSPCP